MTGGPVVFALPGFEALLRPERVGAEHGAFDVRRFANGELHVRLGMPVDRRECLVVGSVAPPERRLVEVLLLADTLRRSGAARVRAVLPYLAYARQDRPEARESLASGWLGAVLAASGVDDVITVDAHSDAALRLLERPVHSEPTAAFLAERLRRSGDLGDAVVVAPDEGAIDRASAVAAALGLPSAWVDKRRTETGVRHGAVVGELRPAAVVIDDILDTGATLVSCCLVLAANGVRRLDVAVTHGLFTGGAWTDLLRMARAIHVTDTVPSAREQTSPVIHVHPVAKLLEGAVRERLELAMEAAPR
jgi:ribose-phosphate pyrophosphokinase